MHSVLILGVRMFTQLLMDVGPSRFLPLVLFGTSTHLPLWIDITLKKGGICFLLSMFAATPLEQILR